MGRLLFEGRAHQRLLARAAAQAAQRMAGGCAPEGACRLPGPPQQG